MFQVKFTVLKSSENCSQRTGISNGTSDIQDVVAYEITDEQVCDGVARPVSTFLRVESNLLRDVCDIVESSKIPGV